MHITVLGSGTSSGIPIVGCSCSVCTSKNPKNKRLRSSCLFEVNGKNILVDTSPDLRQQCLDNHITRVDAVLYTHVHADHIHGIDDMRVFNAYQQATIPVYSHTSVITHLEKCFSYIFNPSYTYPSLTPRLQGTAVEGKFEHQGVFIQMIPCHHGDYLTYNYRIGDAAWLTDTNGIPAESLKLLEGLEVVFLDGLRIKPHPTHFHLEQSLEVAKKIGAKKTYLIHLAHDYDHDEFNKTLPAGVELAYDGLSMAL